jgi:hypothetical protein
MTLDSIVVMFMVYPISIIEELCEQLEMLKEQKKKKKVRIQETPQQPTTLTTQSINVVGNHEKFLQLIKLHLNVMTIMRKIEKIFSIAMLIEGLLTTYIICTIVFVLTFISPTEQSIEFVHNFMLVSIWAVKVFIPCYYCQLISTLSNRLATSLFHSDWRTEDRNYRKNVLIFMENVKKPLGISVLGVVPINLETFMKIVNSAYSMFAIFKHRN